MRRVSLPPGSEITDNSSKPLEGKENFKLLFFATTKVFVNKPFVPVPRTARLSEYFCANLRTSRPAISSSTNSSSQTKYPFKDFVLVDVTLRELKSPALQALNAALALLRLDVFPAEIAVRSAQQASYSF